MKWGVWVALVTPLEPGASRTRNPAAEYRAAELQSCKSPLHVPTSECRPAVYHGLLHRAALRLQGLREAVGSCMGKDRGASAMREALVCEWECVCRVDASMLPRLVWRCRCRRGQTCAGHCSFLLLPPTDPSH